MLIPILQGTGWESERIGNEPEDQYKPRRIEERIGEARPLPATTCRRHIRILARCYPRSLPRKASAKITIFLEHASCHFVEHFRVYMAATASRLGDSIYQLPCLHCTCHTDRRRVALSCSSHALTQLFCHPILCGCGATGGSFLLSTREPSSGIALFGFLPERKEV